MRRKTELIIAGCLELLAVALAKWQALGGVRTDEAKYLLNIPYPHPPLMRWLMSMTEMLPFQEMFWRLLLATLIVQAVWLVWDLTNPERSGAKSKGHLEDRMMICAGWLLSSAVLVGAGSILLAPVMALQTLVFLWLQTRSDVSKKMPAAIALFWLATVFTTYTGVLLFPLVWNILRRGGCTIAQTALYVFGPVVLLFLYTLTNPLALAIILVHRDEGLRTGLAAQAMGFGTLWIIGGAGVASAVGTWGILRSRDKALLLSFILVCAYCFFSITPRYYAVMLTPFFVAGLWKIFHARRHPHAFPLLGCLICASAVITWFVQPIRTPVVAREVMSAASGSGTVLISGPFGHEWQYESRSEVRRYRPEFTKDAAAIVCLNPCEPMFDTSGWKQLKDLPVEAWVRK
ncbi:MAG: hypothetical protein HOO67_05815 [Candidatus Peribacteraceae bacterium]|nr:hypothetical protein [Candidatus Peribacteraceae bacterium]